MFVDHILAIGGLSSASTLLRTCIYVRPGVARVAAVVIQGHISFDANISLFTPESDLVTRRGWIWHFHIDLVFTIPLSLATPGPRWRLHPSQYYKLASPSPAPPLGTLTARTNKSYDVPENRGDLVLKFCSFNFNKFMGPWHWAFLHWATKTKKFKYWVLVTY